MQIQINTDSSIEGHEKLITEAESIVKSTLSQFSDQITRVEVHLSDVNGPKGGQDDKHCLLEARLKGHLPIAVTHQASTLEQAVDGAANKMKRSIESDLGRQQDRR